MDISTNHILVGLGGTGGKILREFKMRMFEEYPDAAERNKFPIGLLYVDSTREMMGIGRADFRVMGQDASFSESEFVDIKSIDLTAVLDNMNSYPALKGVVQNASAVKTAIGALGEAAGQKRRAGRVLFAANASRYLSALGNTYSNCTSRSHTDELMIHIFAGLSGGTGSGSIVDAIVQTRKAYPDAKIMVYAMVAEMRLPKSGMDKGRYYQNCYAALNELSALQSGRFEPTDVTSEGRTAKLFSTRIKGVADGLVLYSNVNENGMTVDSLTELPRLVSDYVFTRVFLLTKENDDAKDFFRAYSFENMDDFCLEYDETTPASRASEKQIARTKKINSFGIKRIIYPEQRILQHVTYTIGRSILYQFKFNNWSDELGFVDEELNKDYNELYFKPENIKKWKLDESHLTLNEKILDSDAAQKPFDEYWHGKAIELAELAKTASCPLEELHHMLNTVFDKQFRVKGVEEFFRMKTAVIDEMAADIRSTIEKQLFEKWRNGEISIYDLVNVASKLNTFIDDQRERLEKSKVANEEELAAIVDEAKANVSEWKDLNVLQRMVGQGARLYAGHQEILSDLMTARTKAVGYDFALSMCRRLSMVFNNMFEEIMRFGQKISEAITETERLITANQKINKGLEDKTGAVIEVSEEEDMMRFEKTLLRKKDTQTEAAKSLRNALLPEGTFKNFGDLNSRISLDNIKDSLELKLCDVIKTAHETICRSDKQVLGLNVLAQLQQELTTDDAIRRFALDLVRQSGVYLKFNDSEIRRAVKNNENPTTNPASVFQKCILVSMPSAEDNDQLKVFADKLKQAFAESFNQAEQVTIKVSQSSPRKNEISIVSVIYCFPMRGIEWLSTYRQRYEDLLNTGNDVSDRDNSILLHAEGDGKNLPNLFIADELKPEQYWPYFILAAALNILTKNDGAWGYSETNKFGRSVSTPIASVFVDIVDSNDLNEDLREKITQRVKDLISDPEMTRADRDSIEQAIIDFVGQEIVPSCAASLAERFENYAEQAIELIKK